MTLRKRLFWLFLPLLAVALLGVWQLSNRILLTRYDAVDNQRLYDQVRILYERLIFERKRNLDFIRIYSWWNESQDFAGHPTQRYIEENLEIDLLKHLGFDFVFYLDQQGQVVAQTWALPKLKDRVITGRAPMRAAPLQTAIVETAKKVGAMDFQENSTGFTQMLLIGGSPVMLVAHPISDDKGSAAPNGALVAGMVLNSERMEDYQLQVGARLRVLPPTTVNDSWRALAIPRRNGGVMLSEGKVLDGEHRQIDMMFLSSRAEPQFRFQITLPRQVYQQGQGAIQLFLGQALAILLATLALAYLILEVWTIRPLKRVILEAERIGQDRHMERLSEVGDREMRQLTGELNQMITRLEQSEAREQAIMNAIHDGYFEMDGEGHFLMVNTAFCKMVGRNEKEMLGEHLCLVLGEEDVERAIELKEKAMAGATDLMFAAPFLRADGTRIHLETVLSTIQGRHGEFIGVRGVLRDISDQVAYEKQLLGMAYQDALTGLGNRKAFNEQLRQALQGATGEQRTALLYFDLDKFKLVNDQLGHAAGDAVLNGVGVRLRNHLRGLDRAYRLGGDEFAVVLNGGDANHAINVATRLLKVLAEPYAFGEQWIDYITPSIGIALAPTDAQDADALTEAADKAMYRAKRTRNCFRLYTACETT